MLDGPKQHRIQLQKIFLCPFINKETESQSRSPEPFSLLDTNVLCAQPLSYTVLPGNLAPAASPALRT